MVSLPGYDPAAFLQHLDSTMSQRFSSDINYERELGKSSIMFLWSYDLPHPISVSIPPTVEYPTRSLNLRSLQCRVESSAAELS